MIRLAERSETSPAKTADGKPGMTRIAEPPATRLGRAYLVFLKHLLGIGWESRVSRVVRGVSEVAMRIVALNASRCC